KSQERNPVMHHFSSVLRRAGSALTAVSFCLFLATHTVAQQTYQSKTNTLEFDYPRRWQAEDSGNHILLTAPDGSHYTLQRDTLPLTSDSSPATDSAIKAAAVRLATPLLKNPELVNVQPVTMDHGQGAVFRFKAKGDEDLTTPIYIAVIGK